MRAFVCVLRIELHFPEAHDLKAKRKLLKSLTDRLRQRFGAAVSETGHHDLWQRATLICALTGDSGVGERGEALERWLHAGFAGVAEVTKVTFSAEDLGL